MEENKFVITGEAPESDEEQTKDEDKACSYGTAVTGEALESDDEIVSYSRPGARITARKGRIVHPNSINSDSILQNKLWQSNLKLWKDLNACIHNTVSNASKELLNTDQQLIKTQVTLQAVSHNFKEAEDNTRQIIDKLENIISGNFIPKIINV